MFTQIKWILGFIFFFSGWDILFPGGFIFLILISKNKQLSDITKDSVCVVLKNQLNKPGLCTKRRGTKWTDGLETLTTMWNRKFRPVPVIRSKFTVHCTSIYLSTLKKNPEMRALKSFFLWQYNKEYLLQHQILWQVIDKRFTVLKNPQKHLLCWRMVLFNKRWIKTVTAYLTVFSDAICPQGLKQWVGGSESA